MVAGRHRGGHGGRNGGGEGGRHGDMVADMLTDKKINIGINMEIQFGERVGHGGWLTGLKLFRPEAYLACASSNSRRKGLYL